MSLLTNLFRSSVRIEADRSLIIHGQSAPASVLCPQCERPLDDGHKCSRGMSRRMFGGMLTAAVAGAAIPSAKVMVGHGLFGATSQQLAQRLEGVPLPTSRVQVIAHAGDAFEVETDRAFTIAWEKAVSKAGNPFKNEAGLLSEGGILEFHPMDFKGDNWLRVHRSLGQMNILGLRDKESGKEVKYRVVRNQDAEQQLIEAIYRNRDKGFVSFRTEQPAPLPTPKEIPTDSKHVSREAERKATFQSASGEFQILYKAGKTKDQDRITWQFMGLALPRVQNEDQWSTQKMRPTKCEGSLHTAIETLNVEYPEVAFKVRSVIMRLNPELRRRTAAVRQTKKGTQA